MSPADIGTFADCSRLYTFKEMLFLTRWFKKKSNHYNNVRTGDVIKCIQFYFYPRNFRIIIITKFSKRERQREREREESKREREREEENEQSVNTQSDAIFPFYVPFRTACQRDIRHGHLIGKINKHIINLMNRQKHTKHMPKVRLDNAITAVGRGAPYKQNPTIKPSKQFWYSRSGSRLADTERMKTDVYLKDG